MDAIKLLEQQHDEVTDLFESIEKARSRERRSELFTRLADALAIHAMIEEKIFYPTVKAKRSEDIPLESLAEHLAVKHVLADLLDVDVDDPSFAIKLDVLREEAERHFKDERTELFPQVRKIFDKEILEELGAQMETLTADLEGTSPRETVPYQIDQAPTI